MKIEIIGERIAAATLDVTGEEVQHHFVLGEPLHLTDLRLEIVREQVRDRVLDRPIMYETRNIEIKADWWQEQYGGLRAGVTTQITLTHQQYKAICDIIFQQQTNISVTDVMGEMPSRDHPVYRPGKPGVARQGELL